jgi:tetratricopeptide (TPR) repeat protein
MTAALIVLLSLSAADPAKEAFGAGKKLYDKGKYADAVKKFEDAYALRPHPVIFFNIGKCYEKLSEPAKAMRAYRDYLRLLPDATDKAAVQDSIANLERKLRDKGVQQLMVFYEPKEAAVEIDGKPLAGPSPATVELAAGDHALTATAEGFEPLKRTLTTALAHATEVTITLDAKKETPAVEAKPEPTPAPSEAVAATTSEPKPVAAEVVEQPSAPRRRVFTWVAAAFAVAGAGAGLGLGLLANNASGTLLGTQHSRMEADQLVSNVHTFSLSADIAYGVAAAALVMAVMLFFLEGR